MKRKRVDVIAELRGEIELLQALVMAVAIRDGGTLSLTRDEVDKARGKLADFRLSPLGVTIEMRGIVQPQPRIITLN